MNAMAPPPETLIIGPGEGEGEGVAGSVEDDVDVAVPDPVGPGAAWACA